MIIYYHCTRASALLLSNLPPLSFHEMIFILVHTTSVTVYVYFPVTSPPTDLTAVQTGPTSIDVSWTPPTPLGDITGYIIYYTNDDNTDSVTIDDGSTDEYTLSDLQNGGTYTISIVATSSSDLPSESVLADMTVGLSESNILYYNNIQ